MELVAELCKGIPQDKAREAARDLDTLASEIASGKPRQKWFEISAEGLMDAAKTVAKMASPIVKTVKDVGMLLGFAL